MPTGNPHSPKRRKGALVKLSGLVSPSFNVISFQYNPETLNRNLMPWGSPGSDQADTDNAPERAQPFNPGETISLSLELHAADRMEARETDPLTDIPSVADRIAALEMLLYPVVDVGLEAELSVSVESSLSVESGTVSGQVSAQASGEVGLDVVPNLEVPVVLFVWSAARVVPVRLTRFAVTEQLLSPGLYPIQAKVDVDLEIITPHQLKKRSGSLSATEALALAAYGYTQARTRALASAAAAVAVDTIQDIVQQIQG